MTEQCCEPGRAGGAPADAAQHHRQESVRMTAAGKSRFRGVWPEPRRDPGEVTTHHRTLQTLDAQTLEAQTLDAPQACWQNVLQHSILLR